MFSCVDYDKLYALVDWRPVFFHFMSTSYFVLFFEDAVLSFTAISIIVIITDIITITIIIRELASENTYEIKQLQARQLKHRLWQTVTQSIYSSMRLYRIYSRQRRVRPYWCNPSFSSPANSSHPLIGPHLCGLKPWLHVK